MAVFGDVGSMGLEEVFGFLTANALQGTLTVRGSARAVFRLYFVEGRIFIPYSDHEGIRSLGKVMQPDGMITRTWTGIMRELRKRSDRFRRIALERAETRRQQYTEEIHGLFLWDEAQFEFKPGAVPPAVAQELEAGRGLLAEPQAIVMEVTRRSDERQLVRRTVPSGRVVLRINAGQRKAVTEALQEVAVDLAKAAIDGRTPTSELLERWGVPHMDALTIVGKLVDQRALVRLEASEAQRLLDRALVEEDLPAAGAMLGHLIDIDSVNKHGLGQLAAIVNHPAFKGDEFSCTWRLDGPRLFALQREMLDSGAPFTLELRREGSLKRVAALPGVLSVSAEGSLGTPPLSHYLFRLGFLPRELAAQELPERELLARCGADQLERASLERVIEELADVTFWEQADVTLRNRGAVDSASPNSLILALNPKSMKRVREGLRHWQWIFGSVPGDAAVFARSARANNRKDPAARFFARFSPRRNVGELRRFAEAPRLSFAEFVAKGIKAGYLLKPTADQIEMWCDSARENGNDILAYRLARAAVAFGYGERFEELLDGYKGRNLVVKPEPILHGQLKGVGLPAVLQNLAENRRSGSLAVTAGEREERVHFYAGDAYVLRYRDAEGDEFVQFLLGDGAEMELVPASDSVAESELEEREVREIKDRVLEVMFWDDASFAFYQNDLPEEFFAPSARVTKIALNTQQFLLEAVRTMNAWDDILRYVHGGASVFRFVDPEQKLQAVREHDCSQTLTLVDGRLSFDDLLRISGEGRLKVGRALADLIRDGALVESGPNG